MVVIHRNNMTTMCKAIPATLRNRNIMNRVYMVIMYEKLENLHKGDNIVV